MIFPLIDGYELQERIGEGGMGAVFLAKRETDGRIVAIKTIRHIFLSSGQAKGDLRFKREIEACKNFAHPYVVKLLDGGFLPKGESFIVMEYLKGTDLDGVARRKTLSEKQCRKIASEMAEALTYVHSANIIHRDVKTFECLFGREWPDCAHRFRSSSANELDEVDGNERDCRHALLSLLRAD